MRLPFTGLVLVVLCWSAGASAKDTTIHPVLRLGWSNPEFLALGGGVGTAWPREEREDVHFRLAAGASIAAGGTSLFVESGLCKTAPHLMWCALDLSLGVRLLRTFDFSSWPTGTYGGMEAGGRLLFLMLRVGVFRRLAEGPDTRVLFFAGLGWP